MNPIATVLFDVGGVLVSENDRTGYHIMERSGVDEGTFWRLWPEIVRRFGSGLMTEQEMWDELAQNGGQKVYADENYIGIKFAAEIEIYHDVLDAVYALKQSHIDVGVLSNTIGPHAKVHQNNGVYKPFGNDVYLSHEIGVRKPDPDAYVIALRGMNISELSSVLFIDDRLDNLAVAEKLGMQIYHAQEPTATVKRLMDLIA